MRSSILILCLCALVAVLAGTAGAVEPAVGTLSVERGRGTVVLEVRGSVLGRLANGSITVVDRSPGDPFEANIAGRRIAVQRRVGPAKVFVRGQGLRFRMLGGTYRIVIRGNGIALSVVGRGVVVLDGEPRFLFDDMGVYSLDGVDCGLEPETCTPIADEPLRLKLEPTPPDDTVKPSR